MFSLGGRENQKKKKKPNQRQTTDDVIEDDNKLALFYVAKLRVVKPDVFHTNKGILFQNESSSNFFFFFYFFIFYFFFFFIINYMISKLLKWHASHTRTKAEWFKILKFDN